MEWKRHRDGGSWIVGDQYTLADVSLTPTIVRLEDCGRSDLWARRPAVAGWLERVKSVPISTLPICRAPAIWDLTTEFRI
ncbi:glutathione S-transferase C-terminal domain-containing protein [Tardiphaga sp.]|uniref:glutathione S-transferase C-terminal domain-containing protein n=1 Tax=Tardiphaga sp. TaxID=1926292 RepID=UPI00344F7B06